MGLSPHSPEAVGAAPPRVVIDTDNRFSLDPDFLAQYAGQQPIWGPLGYIVYKRTYARRVGNRSEEFWETLRRVTEGTFSLLKQQIRSAHRPWDDAEAQRKAQDFYTRMWAFKWLPPGRGLWIMGTDYLERHGGGAANNCGFVSTADLSTDFADPFCALMDWSMLGVGMGFDTRGAGTVGIVRPAACSSYVVEDTREGWIDLIRTTLLAYVGQAELPDEVDVSRVRAEGEPINGFGGTASGPGPLLDLWRGVQRILHPLIGQRITSAAITDLMNMIGRCVVAGNVRRSSEIALGDISDADFLALKDPTRDREIQAEQTRIELAHGIDLEDLLLQQQMHSPLSQEFADWQSKIDAVKAQRYGIPEWAALDAERWALPLNAWRWASNNTVWGDDATGADLRRIGERIAHNGEPGVGWLNLMRSHGRLADPPTHDDQFAAGMNPCQPDFATVLTPEGVKTFADISEGSTIWSGKRWTTVVKKWATGTKAVWAVRTAHGVFIGTEDHKVISRGERVKAGVADYIDGASPPTCAAGQSALHWLSSSGYRSPSAPALDYFSLNGVVTNRVHLGDFPVYDITVEDEEHTYWTGGLLVSNCAEQTLWDRELCCLVETFPTKHLRDDGSFDMDDYKLTLKMAYLYAKVVSGIPTHRPDTNAVMAANRRIGTSQAGVADLYETIGLSECRRLWDESYRYITALDAEYSRWMACPRSIKRTSIKPGGSIPLLPGIEGGMKWASSPFYMRTVRIDRMSPMVSVLQRLGYRVEPDHYTPRSVVAYFPVRSSATRFAGHVSVWEQAELAAALQKHWSDNMVSCTLTFRKAEAADVPRVIEAFTGRLKVVSFLPVSEHGYLQAPYIPCTEAEYNAAVSAITGDLAAALSAALSGVETKAEEERFCSGDRCEMKRPA